MVFDDENEILAQAFRQLSRGAALVARHQRKNVGEVGLTLPVQREDAQSLVRRVLAAEGRVLSTGPFERVLLGSGTWNLHPAVVTVRLDDTHATTSLTVRGVACEGLLKQRAGEAAAARIAGLIRAACRRR